METLAWLCLFIPLLAVVLLTLAGSRISREAAAWFGTVTAIASFLCALGVLSGMLGEGASSRSHTYTLYTWAASSTFKVPFSILVDQLSMTEMLIVSGVGALIVMYSIGYMRGDVKERRFFVYLDLFVFSMLLLVMASNFVLLLAGWGMVGLSSYLLIGFWHERPEPVQAAKKAFIMNAIGDVGIVIAVFFMARDLGTTDFHTVFSQAGARWGVGTTTSNVVALALLVGAVAKSAQIPLHTWLPDAMEGPTPVSALIHAATMVTAGVYLVARAHVLFQNAPDVHSLVALIGVATLLMAGVIALVQTDIKKIIAYSTMSQIGYMFAAVGVSAYSEGMFHLLAHAFFKALLFLGAGIVIHALSNEQDVRKMGGLASALPWTTRMMWVGTIALIGIWPVSKDEILAAAIHNGDTTALIVYIGGLIGAFFTGIYAIRLMKLVFYGERSEFAKEHLHTGHGEGPWEMMFPVAVLAVGTLVVGLLSIGFGAKDVFGDWLASTAPTILPTTGQDVLTTAIAWTVGIGAGVWTWKLYDRPERVAAIRQRFEVPAIIAERKFGWDDLYYNIGYRPAVWLATFLGSFDRWVIGGSAWLVARTVRLLGFETAEAQTGIVRQYAAVLTLGAAVTAVYFLGKGHAVTVALIFLPLAAAVLVGMLPLERRATEGIALLAAMAELALGLVALIRFDAHAGLQFTSDRIITHHLAGIADVHFSVGMDGLSLFMVLLAALGIMSAISAAMWAGRENPRFYFALLLVLEAALVLLFTAQDLVLFYIGWEVMIIPLYILMGVWGGAGRRAATIQFVVFTMIGSLAMLVAIATLGVEGHSFELTTLSAQGRDSVWLFLAFSLAFCIKAPMFPLHGWLPSAYRESTPEVTGLLSGVVSKAGAYGLLRFAIPLFPATAHDWRWLFLGLGLAGLLYGSLVAFRQPTARGVVSFSSLGQMNLIIIGIFALNSDGRTGAIFQMLNHGVVSLAAFLLVGLVELRGGTDSFARLKGLANSRPKFSTVLLMAALWTLAVPGSSAFVSELYVLLGAFRQNAWLGATAACAIVLAAMYALRWLAAIAYEEEGEAVAKDTPDLRMGELGIAVPLLLILLVMTAWPLGIMERIG